VIAIRHDDHYYDLADRIVKLDYGWVEFDGPAFEYLEIFGEKDRRPVHRDLTR
jgi:histidyl-tRNA synthetase